MSDIKEYNRQYYLKNREKLLPKHKKWLKDNKNFFQKYYLRNKPKILAYHKERHRLIRIDAIKAYGNKCACCGISELQFLAIDHVDGNGFMHRKDIKTSNIFSWLKKNGFPPGFQVLCHNCNMAKSFYAVCPHLNAS